MADTLYLFDVLDDFQNHVVALDALQAEISAAAPPITSAAFVSVITSWVGNPARDTCTVTYDDPLSPADEATLNAVVAAHQGAPLPACDNRVGKQAFQTETTDDQDVFIERDGAGSLLFADQSTPEKTLAELATAGTPDLSKVVLEVDGSFVYTGDGDVTTVE